MHVLAAALAFVLGGHGSAGYAPGAALTRDIPTLRLSVNDPSADRWGDTSLLHGFPEADSGWFRPERMPGLAFHPVKKMEVGVGGFLKGFGPSVNLALAGGLRAGVGVYVEKPIANMPIATEVLAGVRFPMPF
jgi:hypothetical protein